MNMQLDFRGKCVFVAGAASDRGRAVAEAFHGLGATVAVCAPGQNAVAESIEVLGGGTSAVPMPGGSIGSNAKQAADTAISSMGGLDVLVCGFGALQLCRVDAISEEHWERTLASNLKTAFFTAQACLGALKKTRGCIVNVASAIGIIAGPPGTAAYATATGGMMQMSRMMALELSGDGIRVNCFCPGWTNTTKEKQQGSDDPLGSYTQERTPLARGGTLEEFAGGVVHLASALASYQTGTILVSDGGLTSGHYLS